MEEEDDEEEEQKKGGKQIAVKEEAEYLLPMVKYAACEVRNFLKKAMQIFTDARVEAASQASWSSETYRVLVDDVFGGVYDTEVSRVACVLRLLNIYVLLFLCVCLCVRARAACVCCVCMCYVKSWSH